MDRTHYGFAVKDDSNLHEDLEAHLDKRDTQSEALRELIRKGIEKQKEDELPPDKGGPLAGSNLAGGAVGLLVVGVYLTLPALLASLTVTVLGHAEIAEVLWAITSLGAATGVLGIVTGLVAMIFNSAVSFAELGERVRLAFGGGAR